MQLVAEGDWDLSNILSSCFIHVRSSLLVDLLHIQEKCKEFFIDPQINAVEAFYLALRTLNTIDEQRRLLYCVDGLHTDVRETVTRL